MSDHDTPDTALVARLRKMHARCVFQRPCDEHEAFKEAADALARRIAEGERLKRGIRLFLDSVTPAMFDSDDAYSEVETSCVDILAALVAEDPER